MDKSQRSNKAKLLHDITSYAIVGVIDVIFIHRKEISWPSILAGFAVVYYVVA